MKQFVLTAVLLISGLARCPAGEEVPPNWMKPIQFEAETEQAEMLISVPLDGEVYSRAQQNLADLRILDPDRDTVSYLKTPISDTRARTIEHRWNIDSPTLTPTDEELTIEFELEKNDPLPERLEIVTPLKNFEQRVRVFGVDDNNERLLADEVIFDYTRYMDVRRTGLDLLEHQFRRFRVTIDNPTSEQESQLLQLTRKLQGASETSREQRFSVERRPFRIERLQLVSTLEKHVPDALLVHEWDNSITQTREDEEQSQTLIEFETRQQPLSRITLVTDSRNFSRKVTLEIPKEKPGKTSWKPIAHGTLSRFEFGEILEEHLTLKIPESRNKTYRLVIENRDSTPLNIEELKTVGPQDQLLFLASPGTQYELHYGADGSEQPDYDTAAIQHLLSEGIEPIAAELGEAVALTEKPGQKVWTLQRIINNHFLLGSLIAIAAMVLALSLYRAVKKIGPAPNSD